jgi:hypothetical protein
MRYMQRRVTRRSLLRFGAAAGATVAGWAAGLVPEIAAAKSGGSGTTDAGRQLSFGEVQAHLGTLHSPDADRFTEHLASIGHSRLAAKTTGATKTIKGQVYVLIELAFSQAAGMGAVVYVVKKNSTIDSVSAVRFAQAHDGGVRVEELLLGADGTVRTGRTATMDPQRNVRLLELDGTVKTANLNELQRNASKNAPVTGRSPLPGGVLNVQADGWNCTTCNLAGSLVAAFGCSIGVFFVSLLCGPGAPVCVLLMIIILGGWCWAVISLGTLFTCCDMGYCSWCRDCAYC